MHVFKRLFTCILSVAIALTALFALPVNATTSDETGKVSKVLVLNFDPVFHLEDGDKYHHELMDGWNNPYELAAQFISDMEEVSHGYVNYHIADWQDINTLPTSIEGTTYTLSNYYNTLMTANEQYNGHYWESPAWVNFGSFDYDYYLSYYNVYNRIDSGEIDEVWIFTGPMIGVDLYSTRMVGRNSYQCNSPALINDCRPFIVYGFNYERSVTEMLENAGYRAESIMNHVMGTPDYSKNYGDYTDWEKFTSRDQVASGRSGVGTIDWTPNSTCTFEWNNLTKVYSYCDDWLTYPKMGGKRKLVNCTEWGNGDPYLHHKWWFNHFPHADGKNTAGYYNNWWIYFTLDYMNYPLKDYNVLVLNFDPIFHLQDGDKYHHELMSWWNNPHELAEQFISDMKEVSYGYVNYHITDWQDINALPTSTAGATYTLDSYYETLMVANAKYPDTYWNYDGWIRREFTFDYEYYLNQYNVYNRIDSGEIDQVWIFMGPEVGVAANESAMFGRDAYWVNGTEHPSEHKPFIVYSFNYERGVGEMLENVGHCTECIMEHVMGKPNYSKDYENYTDWEKFSVYDQKAPGKAGVGNVHFAPNSLTDYDWGNNTYVSSNCEEWLNYPNMSAERNQVNCNLWGNGDIREHHKWWLSRLPHAYGRNSRTGYYNNWWIYQTLDYINDPPVLYNYIAPEVERVIMKDGNIEILFDKFMQISTVTDSAITLLQNGQSIDFTVEAVGEKTGITPENKYIVAKRFLLIPENGELNDEPYDIIIDNSVASYANVTMKTLFSKRIEPENAVPSVSAVIKMNTNKAVVNQNTPVVSFNYIYVNNMAMMPEDSLEKLFDTEMEESSSCYKITINGITISAYKNTTEWEITTQNNQTLKVNMENPIKIINGKAYFCIRDICILAELNLHYTEDPSGQYIIITNAASADKTYYDELLQSAKPYFDDYRNTFDTAYQWGFSPVETNTLNGSLDYVGDIDMFKFTAPITGTYTIYSSDITPDLKVWLYDSTQMQIAEDDNSGENRNFKITVSLTEGQTYYLKVSHPEENGIGAYTINLSMDDYGDDFSSAHELKLNVFQNSVAGYINFTDDVDMFKFTAPITGTYTIYSSDITPDLKAWLYDSTQMQIAEDDNSGENRNFKITVSLTEGQTYYLKVSHPEENGIGAYTINLSMDDYGDNFSSAHELNLNVFQNSVAGYINFTDDVDMFKFTAPITGTYTIYSSDATLDLKTWLYDSTQMQITEDNNSGENGNFKITVLLTEGQTYYLKVSHSEENGIGTYTINLSIDDYGNDFSSAHELNLNVGLNSVAGYINFTDDVDMFKFTAPVTGTYHFNTDPASPHEVKLYNSSMQEIASYSSTAGMSGHRVNFVYALSKGQTYYLLINKATQYQINITVPDTALKITDIVIEGTHSEDEPLTFTAITTGGEHPITWAFYIFENGKLCSSKANVSVNYFEWTPDKAGTYTVRVYATDKNRTRVSYSKSFTVA